MACDIIDTGKSNEEKVTLIPVDIFESGQYKTFYIHPGYIAVMFYPDTDVSRKKEIFAESFNIVGGYVHWFVHMKVGI